MNDLQSWRPLANPDLAGMVCFWGYREPSWLVCQCGVSFWYEMSDRPAGASPSPICQSHQGGKKCCQVRLSWKDFKLTPTEELINHRSWMIHGAIHDVVCIEPARVWCSQIRCVCGGFVESKSWKEFAGLQSNPCLCRLSTNTKSLVQNTTLGKAGIWRKWSSFVFNLCWNCTPVCTMALKTTH